MFAQEQKIILPKIRDDLKLLETSVAEDGSKNNVFEKLTSLKNKNIEFSSNELVNISIKAILKSNNINIHQIAHSFYIDKFVLKESDGIVGYVSNQPFYLDEKNIKYNIFNPLSKH